MGEIFGLAVVRPLGLILLELFRAIGSYGVSVILFALLVKIISIPFAIKGKKNMLGMGALSSEVQQLQKKYANNRVKLNEEMQALYAKHNVNPAGGCLPTVIPLFIMMGLYYAVQQPLKFVMGFGDEVIARLAETVGVDMATAGFYGQITIAEKLSQMTDAAGQFPAQITSITQGMGQLTAIDFNFLGLNLAHIPQISQPSWNWILPILSGVTALLSSIVMMEMQKKNNPMMNNNPSSKLLMYTMPLVSVYFGFIMPGAISIYWVFNNLFTTAQELVFSRTLRVKWEAEQAARVAAEQAEKEAKKARSKKKQHHAAERED